MTQPQVQSVSQRQPITGEQFRAILDLAARYGKAFTPYVHVSIFAEGHGVRLHGKYYGSSVERIIAWSDIELSNLNVLTHTIDHIRAALEAEADRE